ncbi:MAG: hypothetical protein VX589_17970 [Myxococcota bacterium]|nr:hypothetical protein [Myxococcota bacterium]
MVRARVLTALGTACCLLWACAEQRDASSDRADQMGVPGGVNAIPREGAGPAGQNMPPEEPQVETACFDECVGKGADEVTCSMACRRGSNGKDLAESNTDGSDEAGAQEKPSVSTENCLEACAAKGADQETCWQACVGEEQDTDEDAETNDGRSTSDRRDWAQGEGDEERTEEEYEEEYEDLLREKEEQARAKDCVSCWADDDNAQAACSEVVGACEDSLACTQLQWCPALCEGEDCISECNEIIPTGVPLLRAVMACTACRGGPCADECEESPLMQYCED